MTRVSAKPKFKPNNTINSLFLRSRGIGSREFYLFILLVPPSPWQEHSFFFLAVLGIGLYRFELTFQSTVKMGVV